MHSARRQAPNGAWVLREWDDADTCLKQTKEWAELCEDADMYCEYRLWMENPPKEVQKAMEDGNVVRQDDRYDL